jgi:hypothetical protein
LPAALLHRHRVRGRRRLAHRLVGRARFRRAGLAQTLRQVVRTSAGGTQVRIRLSDLFGIADEGIAGC